MVLYRHYFRTKVVIAKETFSSTQTVNCKQMSNGGKYDEGLTTCTENCV